MKMNKSQIDSLIQLASKKLGTTPDKLRSQLENGDFEKALSTMSPTESTRIKEALSNPKIAERILSTQQAKDLYKKIGK